MASFYRPTDRPTTAAIEKSFPLSPRLSPMRRRRDCGNGRRPDRRRETTHHHHHHHALSSEMEGWRDVGSLFSPRIYWITRKAASQAFLYRKGVQTASKIKNGRRERKEGKSFFWRKLLLCSSAHNLFTRRRSPQKGNCGGGGRKSHFEVRKLLPFKGWGRKRTKTEGTTIKVSVGAEGEAGHSRSQRGK